MSASGQPRNHATSLINLPSLFPGASSSTTHTHTHTHLHPTPLFLSLPPHTTDPISLSTTRETRPSLLSSFFSLPLTGPVAAPRLLLASFLRLAFRLGAPLRRRHPTGEKKRGKLRAVTTTGHRLLTKPPLPTTLATTRSTTTTTKPRLSRRIIVQQICRSGIGSSRPLYIPLFPSDGTAPPSHSTQGLTPSYLCSRPRQPSRIKLPLFLPSPTLQRHIRSALSWRRYLLLARTTAPFPEDHYRYEAAKHPDREQGPIHASATHRFLASDAVQQTALPIHWRVFQRRNAHWLCRNLGRDSCPECWLGLSCIIVVAGYALCFPAASPPLHPDKSLRELFRTLFQQFSKVRSDRVRQSGDEFFSALVSHVALIETH